MQCITIIQNELDLTVRLGWIPAHRNIIGNEICDTECTAQLQNQEHEVIPIPGDYFRMKDKQVPRKTPIQSVYKGYYSDLKVTRTLKKKLRAMDRKTYVTISRLWSNHVNLNGHSLRLNRTYKDESILKEEKHACRFCKQHEETPIHLIRYCLHPKINATRHVIPSPLGPSGTPTSPSFSYKWNWKVPMTEALKNPDMWIPITKFFKQIEVNI
jgi:hypothetical protein